MTSVTKRNVLATIMGLQLQNRSIALLVEEKLDKHGGGQYLADERKWSETEKALVGQVVMNCRSSVGNITRS